MPPRVRFAPSPTGYLHVGGARTALFNWLYARRHGGTFVLRIEDTDVSARRRTWSRASSTACGGSGWTGMRGLAWAARTASVLPVTAARSISRRGRNVSWRKVTRITATAPPSDCVRSERKPSSAAKAWQYDRACLALTADAGREARTRRGRRGSFGSRSARPGGTAFDDAVHGRIEFDSANIEDFVHPPLGRHPTYHLSVVVDDVEMAITHVIRGDDHISNTPKHVLLFEALGAAVPRVCARAADSWRATRSG